jgi:hypothetical protein
MENLQEPVPLSEDVNLIGIGFLDGHLHVKLEYNTNDRTNNQANEYYQEFKSLANIHLVGSEIGSSDNVSYLRADTGDTLIEELCFPRVNDISKLEGLKLTYDLETITYIQGEWRVTFKVSPSEE